MTDQDIVKKLRKLFDGCETPGQAFDVLLDMRRAKVQFADAVNAIVHSSINQLDEREPSEAPFECPNCGVSRERRDRCQNPACPDYHAPADQPHQAFKNPKVSFGRKHLGKTLLEIGEVDPGYLRWMSTEHSAPFWREQARLAMIQLSAQAPGYRDTDATGYMDAADPPAF